VLATRSGSTHRPVVEGTLVEVELVAEVLEGAGAEVLKRRIAWRQDTAVMAPLERAAEDRRPL